MTRGDRGLGDISNFVLGACAAVLGVASLFVASTSREGIGYHGGLIMFVLCVLSILYLIKDSFDHAEQADADK